jgi:hypothetical protein
MQSSTIAIINCAINYEIIAAPANLSLFHPEARTSVAHLSHMSKKKLASAKRGGAAGFSFDWTYRTTAGAYVPNLVSESEPPPRQGQHQNRALKEMRSDLAKPYPLWEY